MTRGLWKICAQTLTYAVLKVISKHHLSQKPFSYCSPRTNKYLWTEISEKKTASKEKQCAILSEMWFSVLYKWSGVWVAQQAPKSMAQQESKTERSKWKEICIVTLSYRLLQLHLNLLVHFRNLHQDHPCRQKCQLSIADKAICSYSIHTENSVTLHITNTSF